MWRLAIAMLSSPLLVLAEQSVSYALVTPLCARQAGPWLHLAALPFVLAAGGLSVVAWREARRLQQQPLPPDTDRRGPNRLFLARVALGSALLSLLALLMPWLPQWLLSPCQS